MMVNRSVSLTEGSQYEYIKCVVVGDSSVGKTCLICAWACGTRYSLDRLVKTPVSTVWAIDHYRNDKEVLDRSWCNVDGVRVSLKLWDTFGYHDKNRKFAYRGADVVLLCFSVVRPNSLQNVQRVWIKEIQSCCPATPIVLVGTQADMRYVCKDRHYKSMSKGLLYKEIKESDILTPEAGRLVAKEIGAPYYETSVLTEHGIEELFFNVIRAAMVERRKIKFWNPQLRRVQYPLIQAPMEYPQPRLPVVDNPGAAPHQDLSILLNGDGDVAFDVQGTYFMAHKICLVTADELFEKLLIDSAAAAAQESQLKRTSSKSENKKEDKKNLIDHEEDTDCAILHHQEIAESGGNSCRLLNHQGFFKIEERTLGNHMISLPVVTVNPAVSPRVFHLVLQYLYTGKVSCPADSLIDLKETADLLMLSSLSLSVSNLLSNEEFLNIQVQKLFYTERNERLQEIGLNKGQLTDVQFQLEDGIVSAHKPILRARCEMMFAMFSDNFVESRADRISFPGMDKVTFRALLQYLYIGSLPSLTSIDIIAMIETANRLCLDHLLTLLEYNIVCELKTMQERGEDIVEDVLSLLEPAQLHNAIRLSDWCLEFLCVHYLDVRERFDKVLQNLKPENTDFINRNRWPPDWYLREMEYYEKAVKVATATPKILIQQKTQFSRWQRCKSSCLCFGGRRGKVVLQEAEDLPS